VSGGSTYRVFRRRAGHGSGEARPWRVGATQAEQGRCRESIEGAGVGKMLRGVSSAGGFLSSSTLGGSSLSSSSPPFLPRPVGVFTVGLPRDTLR
jgi:hypothetical protein